MTGSTKESNPQPDGEYGTSLRMFNNANEWYDVVYTCETCMKRLTFRKEGSRLVGQVLDEENAFWIFSDITPDQFHWKNFLVRDNGTKELICEIFEG